MAYQPRHDETAPDEWGRLDVHLSSQGQPLWFDAGYWVKSDLSQLP